MLEIAIEGKFDNRKSTHKQGGVDFSSSFDNKTITDKSQATNNMPNLHLRHYNSDGLMVFRASKDSLRNLTDRNDHPDKFYTSDSISLRDE